MVVATPEGAWVFLLAKGAVCVTDGEFRRQRHVTGSATLSTVTSELFSQYASSVNGTVKGWQKEPGD